jgi:hypothetical protein
VTTAREFQLKDKNTGQKKSPSSGDSLDKGKPSDYSDIFE